MCFAGISAIGSTIAITSTSCGSSSEVTPSDVLPDNVYDIKNNVLIGFKDGIDLSQYQNICDTMQIPVSVTSINTLAFYHNFVSTIPSYITKLTFAEGSHCSSIGERTFIWCPSLTSVDLSNYTNLSAIGNFVFWNCSELTSVTFSGSLKTICEYAFDECSKLTSVTFPSSLETIGSSAFWFCSALNSVTFPSSLATIGDDAFAWCSALSSIDLSNCTNLSSIGSSVFQDCSSLTSVTFPSDLTSIDGNAFSQCRALNMIVWESWDGDINFDGKPFLSVCQEGGTVKVINPTDDEHNSAKLLEYLKTYGGLPDTWNAAD